MFLQYGPSSVTVLPIYPANERRDSDEYAESREIFLQTVDTGGLPEPSGTASTDPNFQHTDAHAPPETMWTLPRTNCSYSRPIKVFIASILQRPQQDKPAIDAPNSRGRVSRRLWPS